MNASTPPAPAAPPVLLDRPLRGLGAWVAHFAQAEIPVLADSAATVAELALNEDEVDAHLLAESLSNDPLMVLRLLSHVAKDRPERVVTDIETVTGALVLLGISPFFRDFGNLPTVEQRLADRPEALAGLQAVLLRAHRAARFAIGFAVHRMDHDAAVIQEAALLHDFAELLLWCHAPGLALEIARQQQAHPGLRSAAAQQRVLGVELSDLQQGLMKAWRLPELLIRLGDDRQADSPAVRNVLLAIRVARHTSQGWDNPAIPDDVSDIAELLQLGLGPTEQLLREIDDR